MTKDPAELEARLFQTIAALRRIRDVLGTVIDREPTPPTNIDHQALKGCATLCASYADSVIDEVTS